MLPTVKPPPVDTGGLNEISSPDKILEAFTSRLEGKQGWKRTSSTKLAEAVLEVSSEDQLPSWRGSIEIPGVAAQDALIVCKLLLGEERYIHSSSCRNSFSMRYDFNDVSPVADTSKRKSGLSPTVAAAAAMFMSTIGSSNSPPSSPAGSSSTNSPVLGSILSALDKQRSGRELGSLAGMGSSGKKLSSNSPSSSAQVPQQKNVIRSQTDHSLSEEDENTSNDEDDKNTVTTDGEAVGSTSGERLSFTRRMSRIAATRLRRVSGVRVPTTSMIGGSSSSTGSGNGLAGKSDPEVLRNRKLRFIRYEFASNIVCVDDDSVLEPFEDELDNLKRMQLNVMGAAAAAVVSGTRISFLLDIDPQLDKSESSVIKAEALSELCGKAHVEDFLARVVDVCNALKVQGDGAWELLRLRNDWNGDGLYGRIRWGAYSGRDSLIVGSQVRHVQLGTGNVESFDMRGTFKVRYESSQDPVNHQVEDRDKLRLVLNVGNRVRHRSKGLGTVQSTLTDDILVRFDTGQLRKYPKDSWQKKMRRVGDDEDSLLRFSCAPHVEVREGVARVQFIVPDCSPDTILRSILAKGEHVLPEEHLEVQDRRVIRVIDANTRILFEQRLMPKPLTPRTFVSKEQWGQVSQAIVVYIAHTCDEQVPEQAGLVRGQKVCDGWVIEPIPLMSACSVTHILCLDLAGFVAPEALRSVRDGVLTSEALNLIFKCRAGQLRSIVGSATLQNYGDSQASTSTAE